MLTLSWNGRGLSVVRRCPGLSLAVEAVVVEETTKYAGKFRGRGAGGKGGGRGKQSPNKTQG